MEEWFKHLDAARRFISVAKASFDAAPEAVAMLAYRAVEHMITALAYRFDPEEAVLLNSYGCRRS